MSGNENGSGRQRVLTAAAGSSGKPPNHQCAARKSNRGFDQCFRTMNARLQVATRHKVSETSAGAWKHSPCRPRAGV